MVSSFTGFTTRRRTLPAIVRAPIDARTWRAVAYLVVAAPLSLAALVVLAVGAWVGLVLSVTVVGIPLLSGMVLAARYYGYVPRALARRLLDEDVPPPPRRRPQTPGLLPWLRASLGDLDGWRAMAFVVVSFPLTMAGAAATALSAYVAVAMLTYPLYWQLGDPVNVGPDGTEHDSAMQFGDFYVETWPRAIGVSLVGVVTVLAAPWVPRAFAAGDRLLVRALLGPTRIAARVADLEATRARAVDDSAATLRRIERDLHDGAQARLVAVAMHIDMATEELAGDAAGEGVARARSLLDTAHGNATAAITELRDLTRSIHPPALDRGLDEALATLTARSAVPARLDARLTHRPSAAIETIAYFCVAELLTNAAKHSGARLATVEVTDGAGVLRLRVTDDGRGGAHLVLGGGLAGLAERVRTVDGGLTLASPPGGPTVATIELPLDTRPPVTRDDARDATT